MALGYLLRFEPTFGFSPREAAYAELVTIVGGTESVTPAQEALLSAQGCRVRRIAGTSQDIERKLAELEDRGTPFEE
jgi:hypothetical protein